MVKVSVIIPVYNAEKYLRECLDSIINQTLLDIEIICVNDGSTDNSLEILEEYRDKDKRIKVFSQENQGQGVARNNAFKHVTGKYFSFVDADDLLELDTLDTCYKVCEEKFLDMAMFQLINYDDDKKEYYKTPLYDMYNVARAIENKIFNYQDLGELIFNLSVTPVNKLYNTRFVREAGVTFPEGTIFEDNIFSWNLVFKAKRLFFIEKYFYIRRVHSNSTMGAGSLKWVDAIDIYNGVWKIFQEHNEFEKYKTKLYNNKIIFALFRLDNIKEQYAEVFFEKWKEDLINVQDNYADYYKELTEENRKTFELVLSADNYNEFRILQRIECVTNKINDIELQNLKINKDFSELTGAYESLLSREKKLADENREIKTKINNLTQSNDRLVKDNDRLSKDNDRLSKDNDKLSQDKNMLVRDKDKFVKDNDNLVKEKEKLLQQNNYLNNETNKLADNVKGLNNEINQLKNELESLKSENQKLRQFRGDVLSSSSWKITEPFRKLILTFKDK